ncbi:MAG: mechanosensitive ion channel [Thermoleophilaceae bacterium]|nr:mechanosensitive ion channel [Thermoleophilaceae bacterium]
MVFAVDIGGSLQEGFDKFFAFLPNLLAFLVILLVGFIVARLVKAIVTKALEKLGVDQKLQESDASQYVERVMPGASPSNGIGRVVFIFVFVFFLFSAIGALQIPALTTFMNQVLAYLPNVIAALAIFILAALVAGAVGGGVAKLLGDTPTGKIVATVVPAVVMVIALFMILNQLQIAPEIVQIAFAATMGALALGLALAFGLGGRPVAERMLEQAYSKGQEQKDQVKRDVQLGRERGQEQAERGKQRAQQEVEGGDSSSQTTRVDPGSGSYRAT